MSLHLNIGAAARMIQLSSPSALDGLYHAVKDKCDALGLAPGRRDNIAPDGPGGNVNIRTIIQFVDSVEAFGDEDELQSGEAITDADKPTGTEDYATLIKKQDEVTRKKQVAEAKARNKEAKTQAHTTLRQLLGTLQARFAAASYKPAPKVTGLV